MFEQDTIDDLSEELSNISEELSELQGKVDKLLILAANDPVLAAHLAEVGLFNPAKRD